MVNGKWFWVLGKKEQPICEVTQMGCIGPGSDLLSRDLSSDYHRRANVSLPGSGWDRVGPLGYDHQATAGIKGASRVSGGQI